MDVRPVGGGLPGADLTQAAGMTPPAPKVTAATTNSAGAQASASIDAALLGALSQPDLARLVAVLEPPQSPQVVSQVRQLVEAVVAAAAGGDVERALEHVTRLVALDPMQVEAIRTEPGVEAVRRPLETLLTQLANVAKLDAETRVAQATEAVAAGREIVLAEWDTHPEILLTIANRLLESGGYVNAVRAAHVAQVVIDGTQWAPAPGMVVATPGVAGNPSKSEEVSGAARAPIVSAFRESWRIVRSRAPGRMTALWKRAPLLVLLLGWLAVGTVAGLGSWVQQRVWPEAWPAWLNDAGFTLWAIGFLALVLFGFYMRVRNVRL